MSTLYEILDDVIGYEVKDDDIVEEFIARANVDNIELSKVDIEMLKIMHRDCARYWEHKKQTAKLILDTYGAAAEYAKLNEDE